MVLICLYSLIYLIQYFKRFPVFLESPIRQVFLKLTQEQANKFAQRKLTNSDFHVWKNEEKRIVGMASVHKYGKVAFTDGVFTDRNERNKGYAKFLMYRVTEKLLNDGFIPILYADRRKVVPNHVYKSIGYE